MNPYGNWETRFLHEIQQRLCVSVRLLLMMGRPFYRLYGRYVHNFKHDTKSALSSRGEVLLRKWRRNFRTWEVISYNALLRQLETTRCIVLKKGCWKLIRLNSRWARQTGIHVKAFVGPSSIMLALMLSGLPGQHFTFHGYLEKDKNKRRQQIAHLERQSGTHIFIEAPYRNQQTLELLLETLHPNTMLCVAWELTMPDQGILSQPVHIWKKSPMPNLHKKNAIFLFIAHLHSVWYWKKTQRH